MSKLNKRLAAILAGLAGIYILTIAFHAARRESNIQAVTFRIDTTGVNEIDLYPHVQGRQEIKLVRQLGHWQVTSAAIEATPISGAAENLLNALVNIPAQRLVSRRKEEWNQYNVGDTSGTRIVVLKGPQVLADYYIGNGAAGEGGLYGEGVSYLRENGHDEVYAVDGFWNGMVDKSLADWRDKTLLRFNSSDVSGITFQGNPGSALSKKDSSWWLGQRRLPTDSVSRYLGRLQFYDVKDFAENFDASGIPDRSISFRGSSGPLATIKAWRRPDGTWVINSSENVATYFSISDSVMKKELWRNPDEWAQ